MWLQFFLWVASFLITDYFRAKLPAVDPSGEGDFQSPTATEGRKVPQVVGGTVKVKGPNTLGYWDWDAEEVTIETGLIFKRDEGVGYRYKVGLALGQFIGECEGMTAIFIGDDKVWDYVDDNGGVVATVADIDLPELFGGETSGGGFQGRFRCHTGNNSQSVNPYLLSKNADQSAWPGFTYVVITDFTETEGAIIGESNNLRDLRVEFQMFSTIADGGLGNELSLTGDTHIIGRDANPISCAFRVLQNVDWSIASSDINFTNFQAAAQICFDEGIGYSQQVDSEIQAFEIIAEIEKHIDGYIGPNPTNGLLEITLARNDYVIADEFQANETNIKEIKNWAKAEWPQTKNEVKVRFVNREKDYKDDHAVAQDMAGRLIAGRPISVTIRFPGLRDKVAANAIVARTSRAYFWPNQKFELLIDRTAYAIRPGQVIVVTHPEIAAVDLPCRVTRTRTGDPVNQTIRLDVVEDVFQFEVGTQAAPQDSEHVPPSDLPVPFVDWIGLNPPRWLFERDDLDFEPRLLFLVSREIPDNEYNIRYRTRATFGGGNYTAKIEDQRINTFVKHGTLRAIETSPEESPAQTLALNIFRGTQNDGTDTIENGAGFYVDGALSSIAGTYNPIGYVSGSTGLAVIDPDGPNEEWIAITTITAVTGGILCEGVVRAIGDSAMREHFDGEDFYFVDRGMYLQANVRESETDGSYGYLHEIRPFAPSGAGSYSAERAEIASDDSRLQIPYPPTNIIQVQLSASLWFPEGELDASAPNNTNLPATNGFTVQVWNRRFDQAHPIFGANSRNDVNGDWPAGSFNDVDPTLNWWLYDLDTTPNPIQGTDAILSGTELGLDASKANSKFFHQSDFQGIGGIGRPFTCRFEFSWENAASPDVGGVPAGVESDYVWNDNLVIWYPDPESIDVIEDTLLLLHFDGFDRTTQVLDYSPFNHLVTLSGGVEIDTDIDSPAFRSPNDNGGHLLHPPQLSQSPEDSPLVEDYYCEVTDISPNVFQTLDLDPGFIMQARVRFTVTPSGEIPIITKWREGDNERMFWFGLNDTTIRTKLSEDGIDEHVMTTGARTWNLDQWYEITVTLWQNTPTQYRGYFFVDGLWDEFEFATPPTAIHDSAAPVRIGSDGDGITVPETTYIDEVRIVRLPLYKIQPYPQQSAPYPGREYDVALLYGAVLFDGSPEPALGSPYPEDHSGITEDLNRWTMDFGIAVQTGSPTSPETPSTFIDTSQSKFGGASLYCGGEVNTNGSLGSNDDGVLLADSGNAPQHDLARNDFTMECFLRFATMPSVTNPANGFAILSKYLRGATPYWGNFRWEISGTNLMNFAAYINDSNTAIFLTQTAQSPVPVVDTWYHAAVVREGLALALYFDGVRVGYDATFFQGYQALRSDGDILLGIGRRHVTNSLGRVASFHGWLDEVRIVNGTAEYDTSLATLTVPTAPFPRDPAPEAEPAPLPPPSPMSPVTPNSPQSPVPAGEMDDRAPSNWQPSNL